MLPNAFASNYIKSGRNVWITDLHIKLGFRSWYAQWPDLMCAFHQNQLCKLYLFFFFLNNQYEQMNPQNDIYALTEKMYNVCFWKKAFVF